MSNNKKILALSLALLCIVIGLLLVAVALFYEQSTFSSAIKAAPVVAIRIWFIMIGVDIGLVACAIGLFFVSFTVIKKFAFNHPLSFAVSKKPEQPLSGNEWRCLYCQTVNKGKREKCNNCGAPKKVS